MSRVEPYLQLQDVTELRQTLGHFDPKLSLSLAAGSVLQRYCDQFSFHKIPAASYHLGYLTLTGELKAWGRIACHWWRTAGVARGTFCFAPGLFDHAGLFQPLFSYCVAQGFDVVCLEMPGHGLSDGQDCAIDSFNTYAAIWQEFLKRYCQVLPQPLIGGGQSTGCTAMTALALHSETAHYFSRLVFFAPLVRPQRWWQVKNTYRLMGKMLKRVPRKLRINSHSDEFNQLLFADILQPTNLSVRWVSALMQWVNQLPSLATSSVPLLILQGTNDEVVDWPYNIPALQQHFLQNHIYYFDDAKHHLANESNPWQQDIFLRLTAFL